MSCSLCNSLIYAKGLCKSHYMKQRYAHRKKPCKVDDCKNKAHCGSLCPTHYTRKWRYNDVRYRKPIYDNPMQSSINALYNKYKDRARKKNIDFNLSLELFEIETQKKCYYCNSTPQSSYKTGTGKKRYFYNGLDRVDNTKGYTKDNIVPCCKVCNRAKGSLTLIEFKNWIKQLKENI